MTASDPERTLEPALWLAKSLMSAVVASAKNGVTFWSLSRVLRDGVVSKKGARKPPTEARPRRRRQQTTNGMIVHSNGRHSFGCVIRDLSLTGARVTTPPGAQLPSRLYVIHLRNQNASTQMSFGSMGAKPVWPFGAYSRSAS